MIFKNINTVFSLCVCVFFFYLFFRVSAVLNALFRFFSFWIVLNVLVQQVNLAEVKFLSKQNNSKEVFHMIERI